MLHLVRTNTGKYDTDRLSRSHSRKKHVTSGLRPHWCYIAHLYNDSDGCIT